ncbi:zinc finger protein, putative [Plasmodium ovale wallikeri]|uniref:Zinc finger protein, putative n=1 Tax=Plasmodium ovale wallikeri TaxID=864142 RepID=A0A1A8YRJ0_PLAOA|nr:zinc finger protein, putative [Plasmodium ovale wallikeri]SBT34116.1 zinc finger protein, putative [Plasmodium ovale wallikeri]
MPKFYKVTIPLCVSSLLAANNPILTRVLCEPSRYTVLPFCPSFHLQTRMCYTFLSGSYCEASKCTFAHTEEELRGSGKALRLCTKFFLDGYCNKEDKCPMAHNINQLDPSVKFTSTELMNGVCDDEESERCKNHLGSKNSQGEDIGNKPNNVHMNSCSMKNGNISSVKNVNMGTTNLKSMGTNMKNVGADVKSVGIDVKNVGENVKSNLNNSVNDSSSGDSNTYDAKSDEENSKVVHNMVNFLNNSGKRGPQEPKKNTLNFCRNVDNKAYKEFLLEGNLASDIFDETKRRDGKETSALCIVHKCVSMSKCACNEGITA